MDFQFNQEKRKDLKLKEKIERLKRERDGAPDQTKIEGGLDCVQWVKSGAGYIDLLRIRNAFMAKKGRKAKNAKRMKYRALPDIARGRSDEYIDGFTKAARHLFDMV